MSVTAGSIKTKFSHNIFNFKQLFTSIRNPSAELHVFFFLALILTKSYIDFTKQQVQHQRVTVLET